MRRTLARGAADLPRTNRSLLAGVVLGDDRVQPPEVTDDFRAAGRTYRHWLTGYLTAVNKLTHNTVDMRGTTDTDGILGLLEQYCLKHPLHSFSRAVEFLVTDLHPKRLTHMPHAP